jgi:hypothetical protein
VTDAAAGEMRAPCYCCGASFPEADLVRLGAHPEVTICPGCVDGLGTRRPGLVRATPVLATDDLDASAAFWGAAGFAIAVYGDDFAAAHRDGVEFHLVEQQPSGRNTGEAYLHVRGVDAIHDEWRAAGLPVTDVLDQPWEMREFEVVDPGGNRLRVGQNL